MGLCQTGATLHAVDLRLDALKDTHRLLDPMHRQILLQQTSEEVWDDINRHGLHPDETGDFTTTHARYDVRATKDSDVDEVIAGWSEFVKSLFSRRKKLLRSRASSTTLLAADQLLEMLKSNWRTMEHAQRVQIILSVSDHVLDDIAHNGNLDTEGFDYRSTLEHNDIRTHDDEEFERVLESWSFLVKSLIDRPMHPSRRESDRDKPMTMKKPSPPPPPPPRLQRQDSSGRPMRGHRFTFSRIAFPW